MYKIYAWNKYISCLDIGPIPRSSHYAYVNIPVSQNPQYFLSQVFLRKATQSGMIQIWENIPIYIYIPF